MNPARGKIWLVNLDPTIGDEVRKVRPSVVVSRDAVGVLALPGGTPGIFNGRDR
jgi:mRNA interferase MazF